MSLISTPAIVLSALRYSETSKIVRLATREAGVQSAIAKGALRPKSRFGAALQLFSLGNASIYVKAHRELHTLAAFDLLHLPAQLAGDLERYTAAAALAEMMLRFAPADRHPESFETLADALHRLEQAPAEEAAATAIGGIWRLASSLGFAPSLDHCVRDGVAVPAEGALAFSTREGGALCGPCAASHAATTLPPGDRLALALLVSGAPDPPALDPSHAAAHRRLVARYVRFHLGEGIELPALEFWVRRPWGVSHG